jgi:NADPH:quinone reductase-like Zn-dependent oxidoreductase
LPVVERDAVAAEFHVPDAATVPHAPAIAEVASCPVIVPTAMPVAQLTDGAPVTVTDEPSDPVATRQYTVSENGPVLVWCAAGSVCHPVLAPLSLRVHVVAWSAEENPTTSKSPRTTFGNVA